MVEQSYNYNMVTEGSFTMKVVNKFLHTPCYSLETLLSYTQFTSTEEKIMISFTVPYRNQSNLQ